LDAGLLIRREDILVGAERSAFPSAVVEVDHRLGELAEVRVPRELPIAEAPRSEGVGPEPSGDGRAAGSVGHLVTDLPSDVGIGEAAERKPSASGQFAGEDHHRGPVDVGVDPRATGSRAVLEAVLRVLCEPTAPETDGVDGEVEVSGDGGVGPSLIGQQDDLRPLDFPQGRGALAYEPPPSTALHPAEVNGCFRLGSASSTARHPQTGMHSR
jgi:hypothetical protein